MCPVLISFAQKISLMNLEIRISARKGKASPCFNNFHRPFIIIFLNTAVLMFLFKNITRIHMAEVHKLVVLCLEYLNNNNNNNNTH